MIKLALHQLPSLALGNPHKKNGSSTALAVVVSTAKAVELL
jgi:hypothetical protein